MFVEEQAILHERDKNRRRRDASREMRNGSSSVSFCCCLLLCGCVAAWLLLLLLLLLSTGRFLLLPPLYHQYSHISSKRFWVWCGRVVTARTCGWYKLKITVGIQSWLLPSDSHHILSEVYNETRRTTESKQQHQPAAKKVIKNNRHEKCLRSNQPAALDHSANWSLLGFTTSQ